MAAYVLDVLCPLAVTVLRIVTDPVALDYYWVPVGVLASAVLLLGNRRAAPEGWMVALAYLPWVGYALPTWRVVVTLPIIVLVGAVIAQRRRATVVRRVPSGQT